MLKTLLPISQVVVAITLATGCCIDRVYQPSECCDGWDSVLGSCNQCGSCGGSCEGRTPCQSMKHSLTCGAGCGEIYWGEWISDPPDPCDPCDDCGNWIGSTCCAPSWWERFKTGLSGWRYGGDGCCDDGAAHEDYGEYVGEYESSGEVIEGSVMQSGPTPAHDGVNQDSVPAPNGTAPHFQESAPQEPKPAAPAEPMLENQNQTRARTVPHRSAPKLLATPNNQPQRHPASVLAKSHKSAPSRMPAKQAMRKAPPQVKQATRFE